MKTFLKRILVLSLTAGILILVTYQQPEGVKAESSTVNLVTTVSGTTSDYSGAVDMAMLDQSISKQVSLHTLRQKMTLGGVDLQLAIPVQLYQDGSFRQINTIQSWHLVVKEAPSEAWFESQTVSVWPVGDQLPTTRILYAVNGTLMTKVAQSDAGLMTQVLEAGFKCSHESEGYAYYRIPISQNGSIHLY